MNAADKLLLEFLTTRAGFVVNQIEHVRCWWQAVCEEGESLAMFLLRQHLIGEATAQIFLRVADGRLPGAIALTLLDRSELEQFRRRLPEVAVTGADANVPDTKTFLAGSDTAHDDQWLQVHCSAPAEPLRVGAKLGKYLLTEWVGQGASGVVYRALHPTLNIPVAIKVLHADSEDRPGGATQLAAEARLLALLNHPNVVRLYDFEADPQRPYLVLEHVSGPSLAELIDQSGRLQPNRAVRILKQLIDALAAAHRLGIVHRDIKPSNVLISRSGEVKLTDLGLASVVTRSSPATDGPMSASARVGTANYVAPEVFCSTNPPDDRSDIYSLGATMYHALTGRPPFEGGTTWEVIERQAKNPPPCPRSLAPDLPANLAELVTRMMAKDPAKRPATIEALRHEPTLSHTATSSTPSNFKQHSSIWRRAMEKLGRVAAIRQPVRAAQVGV